MSLGSSGSARGPGERASGEIADVEANHFIALASAAKAPSTEPITTIAVIRMRLFSGMGDRAFRLDEPPRDVDERARIVHAVEGIRQCRDYR